MAGLVLVGMVGCGQAPQPAAPAKKPPSQASLQWSNISNGFIEDYLRAQPFFAALAGRHEFDGQLPDLSAHGIKREISRLHDARQQISAVDPATARLGPVKRYGTNAINKSRVQNQRRAVWSTNWMEMLAALRTVRLPLIRMAAGKAR